MTEPTDPFPSSPDGAASASTGATADPTPVHEPTPPLPLLLLRCLIGGLFMGLANLVPGISGGTMLLASGIYPRFIAAVSEVTRLRFRRLSLLVLAAVGLAAVGSVVLAAGVIVHLVVHSRWAMYALFIGLTLGGVPVIQRMIRAASGGGRRGDAAVLVPAVIGFCGMAVLGYLQTAGDGGSAGSAGWGGMLIAGVLAAGAMILPGISGGYLLLISGFYLPLVAGIRDLRDAVRAMDWSAASEPTLTVVLPVGVGVLIGIAVVSNGLTWLLHRFERQTLGVLLGLLIGSVVGLWPFQQPTQPDVGTRLKGQTVIALQAGAEVAGRKVVERDGGLTLEGSEEEYPANLALSETGKPIPPEDWPTTFFRPSVAQVMGAVALVAVGFGITMLVARLGAEKAKGPEGRAGAAGAS